MEVQAQPPVTFLDGVFSKALIPALTSSVIPALIYQGAIFRIPALTSSWGPNVILYCPRALHLLVCHMLLPFTHHQNSYVLRAFQFVLLATR